MTYVIVLILVAVAACANSIMDAIQFRKLGKGYDWWDKETSWRRKWKDGDSKNGEAFLGSSTFFVFLTDAWHFFQMVMFFIQESHRVNFQALMV